MGGRVAARKLDKRASVEIARPAEPLSALPAPARALFESDQPVPLGRGTIGKEVRVGRAGALDDPDSAQKSAPAALSVTAPSGPIRR